MQHGLQHRSAAEHPSRADDSCSTSSQTPTRRTKTARPAQLTNIAPTALTAQADPSATCRRGSRRPESRQHTSQAGDAAQPDVPTVDTGLFAETAVETIW